MPNCTTDYKFPISSQIEGLFGVFSALGVVTFAYNSHNIVLEIQETMPSSKEKPSKVPIWRGMMVAYAIVAICYFPVAIVGYRAFGSHLADKLQGNPLNGNILLQFGIVDERKMLIATADFMVFIHVTGSYLVYAMPAFDLMESILVEKFQIMDKIENTFAKFHFQKPAPEGSKRMMRVVTRSLYVLFTTGVACSIPFFVDLLAVVVGFALTPNTYFLPCVIWLKLKKPKAFSTQRLINWFCIITGVLVTVIATIGGIHNLVQDYSKVPTIYQFTCKPNSELPPPPCNRLYFPY